MSRRNPIKGPGKFEGELYIVREVWNRSLEGFIDEEVGESEGLGWYGRFSGKVKGRGPFHVIITENSQGFVSGKVFPTEQAMLKKWAEIEKEQAEFEGELE